MNNLTSRLASIGSLLLCVWIAGCSPEPDKAILGTWTIALPETEAAARQLPHFEGKDQKYIDSELKSLKGMADKMVLSFDEQHIGWLNGSRVTRLKYTVEKLDGNRVEITIDDGSGPKNADVEVKSGKLHPHLGGDYDFIVWERSDSATSALTPDYYRPPQHDKDDRLPQDTLKVIYQAIDAGNLDEAKTFLSAPFLEELAEGKRFHKSVEAFLQGLNDNGERTLKQVDNTRLMIGKGGLWNVAYKTVDSEGSILGMGQYFRLIDNQWKMVSRYTEQ